MDMGSDAYLEALVHLVHDGQVPLAAVDDSVRRVLRVKYALGLFTRPYTPEKDEAKAMLRPETLQLAREAAERSFVLLKNEPLQDGRPVLPLGTKSKIALIGQLGDDAVDMLGAWATDRAATPVTLRAALADRVGASRLLYSTGAFLDKDTPDAQLEQAVETARAADVVVLSLGESAAMSGEAASRAQLTLPGRQPELLERVVAIGKSVVLVLFGGRPLVLPWELKIPAILAAWNPGMQAGPALVRVLYGESAPSGHLTISWPRAVGQEPIYYNHLSTGRPEGVEGLIKFSPRYLDEHKEPAFAFGFGLTYTQFKYGPTQLSANRLQASVLATSMNTPGMTAGSASATVTNTGDRTGEEVVQLYVRLRGVSVAEPVRELKGYQRISLKPGETRTVTFPLARPPISRIGTLTTVTRSSSPEPRSGSVPMRLQGQGWIWI
jgi:beta-glucosidase